MRKWRVLAFLAAFCILPAFSRAETRADFLKLIDRPLVPAAPVVAALKTDDGMPEFHFTYAADAAQRVPGILIEPPAAFAGRRPVVIVLHGTGGRKTDELPLLRVLAARGFIGVAIDGRYHGERSTAGKGTADYLDAIVRAWHDGREHPFYYDTVWDVMRLIDYLDTRPDVDPARIGLMGISKGGIETYMTAAMDERVAVAIPCIGLESFQWALDHNDWQVRISTVQGAFDRIAREAGVLNPDSEFVRRFYARIVPGIDGEFDGPALVKLISPRPLLAINGDSDGHTPLPGLQLCIDSAHAAYHAAGAEDHFAFRIEPHTAHKVNPDAQAAAVDWLARWLRP
jgi:dienelactone hydrolase